MKPRVIAGVPTVEATYARRLETRAAPDELVVVCWCERRAGLLPIGDVRALVTFSCGAAGCERRGRWQRRGAA